MESSEIKTAFLKWNKAHRRNAWRVSIDNTIADSFSWFGGHPTATADCAWPTCAECTKPMRFFLQLDLASLPEQFDAPLREGILQLFYCSSDDGMCDTWEAFSGTHELRLVQKSEAECACPETVSSFAKSVISDWQIIEDAPSPVEHENLGIKYDYDFTKNVVSVAAPEYGIELSDLNINLNVAEAISESNAGDKLGGWPAWVQGPEYPQCPKCQQSMDLLFQLDSNDNLDYMFGDVGCAHITQCRDHPRVLAFAWACG